MNKNARKLIPAVAMLLVSASMLSTASFAWFSMNNTVKSEGMRVQVIAPGSLMIASLADKDTAANYKTSLNFNETTANKLAPVSSADALKFFMADPSTIGEKDANADKVIATTVIKEVMADNVANAALKNDEVSIENFYGVKAKAWMDYTFYVATTTTIDKYITLDTVNIKYATVDPAETSEINKAIRVGVLSGVGNAAVKPIKDASDTNENAINGSVYKDSTDSYTTPDKAWGAEKTAADTGVTPTGTVDLFTPNTEASIKYLFKLTGATEAGTVTPANAQAVTLRIWLEGESANCKTNFATLTNMLIDVSFSYVDYKPTKA